LRRFLIIISVGFFGVIAVGGLGLYAVSRGYFDSAVPHEPPPESPVLDTTVKLPPAGEMEALAKADPIGFLRDSLIRYRKEVRGYFCTLQKQERIKGKLGPAETIGIAFREDPFSVLLVWHSPPAGMADRALYVAGQNGGKALARGKIMHIVHHRDPYSADATNASRVALPEFGIAKGTERTLAAWEHAAARGALKVEYPGVRSLPQAGGVPGYVLRRTCNPPEEDGVQTVEVSFDLVHCMQVGNVLTAADNELVAAYYFRDVAINPPFPADQFDPKQVK